MERIALSNRALVWAGYGIRLHGEIARFRAFLDATGLECVTTWTAADLLPTDHPQNIGIVGISGQPGANAAVHEADHLLVLGSSMSIPQCSTVVPFAPNARKEVVHGQALGAFFDAPARDPDKPWAYQHRAANRMPQEGSYAFNDMMTRMLPPGSVMVVDGGGTALYTGFQSSYIKEGSRLICSSAMSAMGSGLPEAVGAAFASPHTIITCIIGDGSLMLNVQELQTIAHHNLPIKVFVVSNGGYLAIRHTQAGFLGGRFYGVGQPDLSFPSVANLARAFGIPYFRCTVPNEEIIGTALEENGPAICEWICPQDQKMVRQKYTQEGGRFVPHDLSEMDYA